MGHLGAVLEALKECVFMEACCRAAASRVPSSLKDADPGVGGGALCVSRPSSAVSCAAALAIRAAKSLPGSAAGAGALPAPARQAHQPFRGAFIETIDLPLELSV